MTETTAPARDLTAEFRADRYQQIANLSDRAEALEADVKAGKLRKIANGRFQVTEGWDKGEILSDQGMPEHGLDLTEDGGVAFYSNTERPWHALGTVIPGGLTDIDAVLRASGLNWNVVSRTARFFEDEEAETGLHVAPADMRVMVRDDTWAALGQVGNIFKPFQNREGFAWLASLAEEGVPFETAGSFRGGKKVFMTMEIPGGMEIDVEGAKETVRVYLQVINNHDGNGKLWAQVAPYRIECKNLERLAVENAVMRWGIRHTKGMSVALDEAARSLRLTRNYMDEWIKEETKLAQTSVTDKDIAAVIADIWSTDEDKESVRAVKSMEARVADIMERWTTERARCGSNGYALERALTGHVDHATQLRPRGDLKTQTPLAALGQAMLEGTGDEKKAVAHKRVMALVRK